MTSHQALAFAVIGGAVALFASGRFRYDLVALFALLVGVATGLVPAKSAFSGFTSDVVVIIACALIVSAAVARAGIIELWVRPWLPRLKTASQQVPALAGATALLSMATKNVGALTILMPTALGVARTTSTSPSSLLMPMAFMSLLGGLVTLVGTSTNIIVSQVREDTIGRPFQMFDFAPVGLTLTLLGLIYVSLGWRLLPRERKQRAAMADAAPSVPVSTEASVPAAGLERAPTLGELKLESKDVEVTAVVREGRRLKTMGDETPLKPDDVLLLHGAPEALDQAFAATTLTPARHDHDRSSEDPGEEMRSVEGVVQPGSMLIGRSAQRLAMQQRFGVNLLAVGRRGERIVERLRDIRLRAGDVLVLRAGESTLPEAMKTLDVLPLVERDVKLGGVRRRYSPLIILAVAMLLVAFKITPIAIAFFGAAILIVASGALSMREAYASLEGEVLVLIGALTPLSEAVHTTGGTALIAHGLAHVLQTAPPLLALGALMATAMACSPFLHNAPTVLVLGPIAVALAQQLHLRADAFLMAVATGAGCDFLSPIGHQCNTLVRGPGGYRFGDYARLGAPLSVLVIVVGTPLIALVWKLTAG